MFTSLLPLLVLNFGARPCLKGAISVSLPT